jgi:AraC-like DNA-binding protein
LRSFLLGHLYIVTGYIVFMACIMLLNVSGSLFHNIVYFILGAHLFLILLAQKLSISQIMPILNIYWIIITFVILMVIIAMGQYVGAGFFVWFFAATTGFTVLYSGRKLMYWIIYLAALVIIGCFCFYIQRQYTVLLPIGVLFHTDEVMSNNSKNKFLITNIITILSAFALMYHFVYYKQKITEIKINSLLSIKEESRQEKMSAHSKSDDKNKTDDREEEKFKELFHHIHVYMDTHRPYINPEFTIHQMAHELTTNATYINKAIKQARDLHFNIFVNQYRIENVKAMMESDPNKFTFEYISVASGFRNLSTFNKAFKIIEGVTPSEYCKKIKTRALQESE